MPENAVPFNNEAFRLYILGRIQQSSSVSASEAEVCFHNLTCWELACYLGECLTGEQYAEQWHL